jgi:uncharacterized membrane protein YbaN (DUF454 family)
MRYFLFIAGGLSLGLGILGVFLPLLPTTPFLLLSSACFIKSSPRLYSWMINHRVFGMYLRLYMKYRGITKKSKTITIFILWGSIIISIILVDILWVRILLTFIAAAVSLHILTLKTITPEMLEEDDQAMGRTGS